MKLEKININNIRIETSRLIMRPFEEKDLNDFYEYASENGVGESAGWKHHESIEESKEVLKTFIEGHNIFAIEEKLSGKVIGSIGFGASPDGYKDCKIGENINDISYVIGRNYWDKDYASEALSGVISHAFYMLNLDAVTCACFKDNDKSKAVFEQCGFVPVADGKYTTQLGETYEAVYYALTHSRYGIEYVSEN